MDSFPTRLEISNDLFQAALEHVLDCLPDEACGLIGGLRAADGAGLAQMILPVENSLHSPTRFRMEPAAQLQAMLAIESGGLDLLAIFHSHPNGPPVPSITDRAEFAYPGSLVVIFAPSARAQGLSHWSARAFCIEGILQADAPMREVALQQIPCSPSATGSG
jgi:proteasome lid subunit RPN8/RPN11